MMSYVLALIYVLNTHSWFPKSIFPYLDNFKMEIAVIYVDEDACEFP